MEFIIRKDDEFVLLVDETIYSRSAILKTCYWFTDRCYVFVYRHDGEHLAVRLTAKLGDISLLEAVVGEFENALLDQQLRFEIERETATLRELIVAKAFADTDLLEDQPFGDDRDPVEVAGAGAGQSTTEKQPK